MPPRQQGGQVGGAVGQQQLSVGRRQSRLARRLIHGALGPAIGGGQGEGGVENPRLSGLGPIPFGGGGLAHGPRIARPAGDRHGLTSLNSAQSLSGSRESLGPDRKALTRDA